MRRGPPLTLSPYHHTTYGHVYAADSPYSTGSFHRADSYGRACRSCGRACGGLCGWDSCGCRSSLNSPSTNFLFNVRCTPLMVSGSKMSHQLVWYFGRFREWDFFEYDARAIAPIANVVPHLTERTSARAVFTLIYGRAILCPLNHKRETPPLIAYLIHVNPYL